MTQEPVDRALAESLRREGGRVVAGLAGYHHWHAARAELLRRSDRVEDAAVAYRDALACRPGAAETPFLEGRLAALTPATCPGA